MQIDGSQIFYVPAEDSYQALFTAATLTYTAQDTGAMVKLLAVDNPNGSGIEKTYYTLASM